MPPKRVILKSSSGSSAESLTITNNKPTISKEYDSDISLSLSDQEDAALEGNSEEELDMDKGSFDESPSEIDEDEEEEDSIAETQRRRLTARQQAVFDGPSLDSTPSLDILMTPRALTEEEHLRKNEISRRRRQQRDQKLERSKTETIQKLLEKRGGRSKKMRLNDVGVMTMGTEVIDGSDLLEGKAMRLVVKRDEVRLDLGKDLDRLEHSKIVYPDLQHCAARGCKNERKYLHAKSKRPVCSFTCYKSL